MLLGARRTVTPLLPLAGRVAREADPVKESAGVDRRMSASILEKTMPTAECIQSRVAIK